MKLLLKIAIGLLIAFVVIVGAGLLFSARPTPITGVDASSLAHSVKSTGAVCRERSDGSLHCALEADKADTHYEVDVGWDGCWDAIRTRGPITKSTPRSLSGCIDIWDHLQFENIFD